MLRTNYTNFTIGEKFWNFVELYNVMELLRTFTLGYKPTIAPLQ